METYVHGTLEQALLLLDKIQRNKNTERIGNLFEDLFTEEKQLIPEIKDSSKLKRSNLKILAQYYQI